MKNEVNMGKQCHHQNTKWFREGKEDNEPHWKHRTPELEMQIVAEWATRKPQIQNETSERS